MVKKFKIDIFADGADIKSIKKLNKFNYISGFTTNPSLMRKAKINNYKKFALEVLKIVNKKPVSFEVFSDDLNTMKLQAEEINSWGRNAYVKIPITNTKGKKTTGLIKSLSDNGIKCNVTAILTIDQVKDVYKSLNSKTDTILSIFSGRIADTGIDPIPFFKKSLEICKKKKNIKLLWASTREVYNLYQAENIKAHIITVPYSILDKMNLYNVSLKKLSLDTVKTFYKDAKKANFKINT
tara:strand:+ start:540 stop:1256 length:717 start_codon:yes stop_codon:yes gene_type:complete